MASERPFRLRAHEHQNVPHSVRSRFDCYASRCASQGLCSPTRPVALCGLEGDGMKPLLVLALLTQLGCAAVFDARAGRTPGAWCLAARDSIIQVPRTAWGASSTFSGN